jgi:hypothetical protein
LRYRQKQAFRNADGFVRASAVQGSAPSGSSRRTRRFGTLCILVAVAACSSAGEGPAGGPAQQALQLTVRDAETGAATPARIELLDDGGRSHVPGAALAIPAGECAGPPSLDAVAPPGIFEPATGTTQFYVTAPIDIPLPAGRYRITAQKGLEYELATVEVDLGIGETRNVAIDLSRWSHQAAAGWFSADGHLHIARRTAEVDPILADWMRAEDLNVANLLQMGSHQGVVAAAQRSFGEPSVHQVGDTILASAQENPRAWILGHGIVLGARTFLDSPDDYLIYRRIWEEARAQGALSGYAHWGGAGLLVDAPTGLVDFLEVLQFDVSNPAALYEILDLGFRLAPVAGTDFPCWPAGPPGTQRFYTWVEEPLTYAAWLEGVRKGATFVTNGPMLELSIDDAGIGDDLELGEPGLVRVTGSVRFDPSRDDVSRLELVREGEVVHWEDERTEAGSIRFEVAQAIDESTWFALRSSGSKVAALPSVLDGEPRASSAHTGAIYVRVAGGAPLAEGPRAAEVSDVALGELGRLEARFSEEAIERLQGPLPEAITGITVEVGRRDRKALLEKIEEARRFYDAVASGSAANVTGPSRGRARTRLR